MPHSKEVVIHGDSLVWISFLVMFAIIYMQVSLSLPYQRSSAFGLRLKQPSLSYVSMT